MITKQVITEAASICGMAPAICPVVRSLAIQPPMPMQTGEEAAFILSSSTLNVTGGAITGNTTGSVGGGIRVGAGSTASVTGGAVYGNQCSLGKSDIYAAERRRPYPDAGFVYGAGRL